MLQCHVWQFTEDVLFLKQRENKSAKNPKELISKADGIKALILHIEGKGVGELVHSDLEKNCRAFLQKENIIKIFTLGRVVHIEGFTKF